MSAAHVGMNCLLEHTIPEFWKCQSPQASHSDVESAAAVEDIQLALEDFP